MAIQDIADLQRHLQWALELEHATIPPYLCALYSLHDGANAEATRVIKGVVMEEMLHLTLIANLLNAVGGKPVLDKPEFIPEYPAYLPHSADAFKVGLLPFCPDAVDTFLKIERPARPDAPPEAQRYHTIGQFYKAIDEGLSYLADTPAGEKKLFVGTLDWQVGPQQWYYGGGGDAVVVTNLESARRAIKEVMTQGEGLDHGIFDQDKAHGEEELAHYFRFEEIRDGRHFRATDTPASGPTGAEFPVDWAAVYPMRPNPKAQQYVDRPAIHHQMVEFNRGYSTLLRILHQAFNGQPGALFNAVPAMYSLKYRAQALMKIPSGDRDGSTVGPSFEYVA